MQIYGTRGVGLGLPHSNSGLPDGSPVPYQQVYLCCPREVQLVKLSAPSPAGGASGKEKVSTCFISCLFSSLSSVCLVVLSYSNVFVFTFT